ncbi:hypothetical protein [Desulfurispira natronophila]|uniref:Uncharacterized protein n=1 Tax=Desulfurispira natronophila TaxID=682562 RepID=A0A7W7Y6M7_9BACT|nr:hypothetical protein [Desulfurispira natronophila]MBB5022707.1 hypothetical protein [Desulfurispira natronophila]
MQKRIYTQGALYGELRHLLPDERRKLILARYDDGIYLETQLEPGADYAIALQNYSDRQMVIAMGLLKEGKTVEEIESILKGEY